MEKTYLVHGILENGKIIRLDKHLPIRNERVSIIVKRSLKPNRTGKTLVAWLNKIHQVREKVGAANLTKEQVDLWINRERAAWEE